MRDTPAWRRHGRQACLAADRSDGRKAESLDEFWQGLRPEQQTGIKAVAMDMWDPYIRSTYERLDGAEKKIVFDKFHIAKHLREAADKARRAEHRALKGAADDRLKGAEVPVADAT